MSVNQVLAYPSGVFSVTPLQENCLPDSSLSACTYLANCDFLYLANCSHSMAAIEQRKCKALLLLDGLKYQLKIHESALWLSATQRTMWLCPLLSLVYHPNMLLMLGQAWVLCLIEVLRSDSLVLKGFHVSTSSVLCFCDHQNATQEVHLVSAVKVMLCVPPTTSYLEH